MNTSDLAVGQLVEATIAGTPARTVRRRLDRKPYDQHPNRTVISGPDSTNTSSPVVVLTDTIRVIDAPDPDGTNVQTERRNLNFGPIDDPYNADAPPKRGRKLIPIATFVAGLLIAGVGFGIPLQSLRAEHDIVSDRLVVVEQIADDCADAAAAWRRSAEALRESGSIMGDVAADLLGATSIWSTDYAGITADVDEATSKVDAANNAEANAPDCDN